ncbi:MAG TPA: PDZ domain-containing protein [Candidatus Eisenbacteria bacterium]
MKAFNLVPMGAALFALGLGLSSVARSPALAADDEDSGTRTEKKIIRIEQEDRGSESDAGYLGVQVQRLTASLRRAKGIPESTEGTLVSTVEDGSPADDGGVRRGDVIVEVNRESTPDPNSLVQIVRSLEPGRRVPVRIWRDGVTRTVTLKVGSRPEGSEPSPPRMPGWEGRDNPRGMPNDESRIILRGNRNDLERQVRELQEQLARLRNEDLARLEREVRELRSDLKRQMDRRYRDRDEDRSRSDDRDRDLNEED